MWQVPALPDPEPLETPLVAAPVTALVRLLDELREMIERLDDREYAEQPQGQPSGSIGTHVRHCLDHVAAFLDGVAAGACCYDRRARGTAVETSRSAALARLRQLTEALLDLDPAALDRPLRVEVQLDRAGGTSVVRSTAGRELAFVISHSIHHNATMRLLLKDASGRVSPRFGVAPSTPSQSIHA